ncbi:hypothetical protein [Latilactobacillus phage TMW 1.1381 P1]|nr:hypothetical protein [Latilactobacillus phage TMW 1.1381 P1]
MEYTALMSVAVFTGYGIVHITNNANLTVHVAKDVHDII